MRETARQGLAGQVGTASVGAWPTSTIFAEAAEGAMAQASAAHAAMMWGSQWHPRIQHEDG